jgi:hypothetical protein
LRRCNDSLIVERIACWSLTLRNFYAPRYH